MKIAVFSTKPYDQQFLNEANRDFGHQLDFFEARLMMESCALAEGYPAICVFVNDLVDFAVIDRLARSGLRLIALRCAGFNNVDLQTAHDRGIPIVRVPAYSPTAVAEHAVGLMMALNRKFHRAYARVREGNFALQGLIGFEMWEKKIGIVGLGRIGVAVAQILRGFGSPLMGYDPMPSPRARELGIPLVSLDEIFEQSDIITLHCPLSPETHHLINRTALMKMKEGVMLINTSRGGLIDTLTVIEALKSGRVGYLGLDVYEEEGDLFFQDLSDVVLQDDTFARLLTFPNVLITGHQAYFTQNALSQIAHTTLGNVAEFERTGNCLNRVTKEKIR